MTSLQRRAQRRAMRTGRQAAVRWRSPLLRANSWVIGLVPLLLLVMTPIRTSIVEIHWSSVQEEAAVSPPLVTSAKTLDKGNQTTVRISTRSTSLRAVTASSTPKCVSPCLSILGGAGRWVQDWNWAKEWVLFQGGRRPWVREPKRNAGKALNQFRPSEDAPLPWFTSWKWIPSDPSCPIMDHFTVESVCRILEEQQIERILFHGDSLQRLQFEAFINRLGHSQLADLTQDKFLIWIRLTCPDTTNGSSRIVPILAEKGNGGLDTRAARHPNNYSFAPQTLDFVREAGTHRMLMIMNIGAHYHEQWNYEADNEYWLSLVESWNRPQDLVLFRTSTPGHLGCIPRNLKAFNLTHGTREVPYEDPTEYVPPSTYAYDKFRLWNKITLQSLQQRQQEGRFPVVHFLDVYNMSVMRKDGHVGGADCLHYNLPGTPPDWWNFVWLSYLEKLPPYTSPISACQPILPPTIYN